LLGFDFWCLFVCLFETGSCYITRLGSNFNSFWFYFPVLGL
jgi:hypothetical protein